MTPCRVALLAVLPFLVAASAGPSSAVQRPTRASIDDDLVVEALTREIWLYRATFELGGRPVESNGLLVRGSTGVVVVDTPWDDRLTGLLLDWVGVELGDVRAVVATHFHPDRLGGIAEVHRRGIASYGHAETARLGAGDGLEPPRHVFSDSLTLSAGGRPIELWYPGPGHSVDNIVVWLPEERLLFGGCMVKSLRSTGLGFTGDAAIESWAASLEALLERYPDAGDVVPGHGDLGDLEAVRHTRDLVLQYRARQTPTAAGRHRGVSWVAQPYEITGEHLDALVEARVDWIVQTPFGWQTGAAGTEIDLFTDAHVFWGERDVGIERTTRLARERGIKTLLKPHVWIRRADGKWRSDIAMTSDQDWGRWFASYRRFILHYARLAERLGIEALCVGTELRRTVVERPDDWRALIAEIRGVYGGELTYAANWYREFEEVPFWSDLDYIGIQAYFPLAPGERPSLAELKGGWEAHLDKIERVQQSARRPVIFTEIGYRSAPGATAEPWVWPEDDPGSRPPVELALQADAYRAFFEVFWHREWMAGVYFWKWYPVAPPPANLDFTPQAKPAERVMRGWFGGA